MTTVLGIVAALSYLFALFAAVIAGGEGSSDIQWILAGVFATCGSAALAGVAICNRIEELIDKMLKKPPTETT